MQSSSFVSPEILIEFLTLFDSLWCGIGKFFQNESGRRFDYQLFENFICVQTLAFFSQFIVSSVNEVLS